MTGILNIRKEKGGMKLKAISKVLGLVMVAVVLMFLPQLATANNPTVICVWQDTDSNGIKDTFLGHVYAYSGGLTAADNYDYYSASAHPIIGPTPVGYESKMYFYEGTDGLSFGMFHNIDVYGSPDNIVHWDVDVTGTDADVFLSDDPGEFSEAAPNHFDGDWHYWHNTDGGVIGDLIGNWEIVITPIQWGDITSWDIYSADGSSISLDMSFTTYLAVCQPISVDIKPGSWPNPINVRSKGVFAVAICGTEDFDVMTIDPATVKIHSEDVETGVSPLRWSWEDIATPYTADMGGGHALDGDGLMDLVLHFKTQEAASVLTITEHIGQILPLIIRGNLFEEYDGTRIEGRDNVWILG